jgi:type I site-specific restriction endonuclease
MNEADIISIYSLQEAIEDGFLAEIFKNRWEKLSGGIPIVATSHLYDEISLAGLQEIWNDFINWQRKIKPTLPEEEQLFVTKMNGNKVIVTEPGEAFTLMYLEDY